MYGLSVLLSSSGCIGVGQFYTVVPSQQGFDALSASLLVEILLLKISQIPWLAKIWNFRCFHSHILSTVRKASIVDVSIPLDCRFHPESSLFLSANDQIESLVILGGSDDFSDEFTFLLAHESWKCSANFATTFCRSDDKLTLNLDLSWWRFVQLIIPLPYEALLTGFGAQEPSSAPAACANCSSSGDVVNV